MKKCLTIFIFCVVSITVTAQKVVSVSGEYTYHAPSTMSLEVAKQEALLQTKLHVLSEKFNQSINQTTTSIVENVQSNIVSSRAEVRTLSTREVKGEWISDTRPAEQEYFFDETNSIIIKTRVWGEAREIVNKVDVDVRLLKDTLKEAVSDVFRNEQEFYLYFNSPVSGYLVVYLIDTEEDMAYCLLPYENDIYGSVPIKSNSDYILFKDEAYMFITDRSVIYNHLSIIFSPNEFYKAKDEKHIKADDELYQLPRNLSLKEYEKWIHKCKSRDPQMLDKRITVKIVK